MTARARRGGRPTEVELKYTVSDPDALRAALDAGGVLAGMDAGAWREVRVEDRYLDTPDGALRRQGYGARLRRLGGRTLVTVKTLASTSRPGRGRRNGTRALHRREEYEAPALNRMDPDAWPASEARDLVVRLVGGAPLRTQFVVRQDRLERELTYGGRSATLSLDTALVRHRGRQLGAFGALEVESADGSTELLERLATELEATGLVDPETRSKEEIARELVARLGSEGRTRRLAHVSKTPGVRPDDPLSEAGRKVLRLHLARMLAQEAGTRSGEDPEDLHKMRVATRRMRAVWRTFDGAYDPKLQKRYVRELRSVARALGAVRDLDVQLESLATYEGTLLEDEGVALKPLREEWSRRRERAREELLALLDSRDYERFVDDYVSFVETAGEGTAQTDGGRPLRVRDTAAGKIWTAFEQVRTHDGGLRWADVTALHALRIDGKGLRYSLESFREVLAPTVEELIAGVTQMQDHLGAINDAHVAAGVVREWLMAAAPCLPVASRDAAGAYLLAREAEIPRLRRTFPSIWRRVTGPAARRRLALCLARL